eukprot:5698-Heterococcus_DN1.PRE.2
MAAYTGDNIISALPHTRTQQHHTSSSNSSHVNYVPHEHDIGGIPEASTTANKFIHCIDRSGGNVVVEWRQRPNNSTSTSSGTVKGPSVQEIFIKYRVPAFPSIGEFYLLVYNDHHRASLHEIWHVVVQSRLRLDVHSPLGQSSATDLVVRGDRFTRRVQCFSSSPTDCSFDPGAIFQLVPGAYNRVEMRYRPNKVGSAKIQELLIALYVRHRMKTQRLRCLPVNMVDIDTRELVGAWLATATAQAPVVTKAYDLELPIGKATHKRIAYANPWSTARTFRLSSSNEQLMAVRYSTLEVEAGGTGFIRVWLHAPAGHGSSEVFLFVNDGNDQNEECLLIRMRTTPSTNLVISLHAVCCLAIAAVDLCALLWFVNAIAMLSTKRCSGDEMCLKVLPQYTKECAL